MAEIAMKEIHEELDETVLDVVKNLLTLMQPVNRLINFERLCELIAKEIAVSHDGIENTSDDFKPDSIVAAHCVKECVKRLLDVSSPATINLGLKLMFDLPTQTTHKNNDFQSKICTSIKNEVPFTRRTVRRRSSTRDIVYVGERSQSSVEVYSKPSQFVRRIKNN